MYVNLIFKNNVLIRKYCYPKVNLSQLVLQILFADAGPMERIVDVLVFVPVKLTAAEFCH